MTSSGLQQIDAITPDTEVISFDDKSRNLVKSMVGRVFKHDGITSFVHDYQKNPLVKLTVTCDKMMSTTMVTEGHPYLDTSGEYKHLKFFGVGDCIQTTEGPATIVDKETIIDGSSDPALQSTVIYNLEMKKGPHNYLVNNAIVHNGGEGDDGGSGGGK